MYDRDALLVATDLGQLADELLGPHQGTHRSPAWPCPNPHHPQTGRTPPVHIFLSRHGEQRWRCHGCGDGGTAIDLVLATRGGDIRGALDHLAARVGTEAERPSPPTRHPRPTPSPPKTCTDPEGLARYVDECAAALWSPAGRTIRRWLTATRALPENVLRTNKIGADLGSSNQQRPDGVPRAAGTVLPVLVDNAPIYAQLRVLHPGPGKSRYLNPASRLGPNPKVSRYEPATRTGEEIVITEGAIDALSAAAAGRTAVAVLSAGYPDPGVAYALAQLPSPLLIAFDPDGAGRAGAQRLKHLLAGHHRSAPTLQLANGDLNDSLRTAPDWPKQFETVIADARRSEDVSRGLVG